MYVLCQFCKKNWQTTYFDFPKIAMWLYTGFQCLHKAGKEYVLLIPIQNIMAM